jgi:hypothetical protein
MCLEGPLCDGVYFPKVLMDLKILNKKKYYLDSGWTVLLGIFLLYRLGRTDGKDKS